MNTLLKIIMLLLIITSYSCSTDDAQSTAMPLSFETLTRADIAALEDDMSVFSLNGTNDSGILWESGKVLLYKTSDGRFGKLEILNISSTTNFTLTISAVTYNDDGSIYNSNEFIQIPGTFQCDLDEMTTIESTSPFDFFWRRVSELLTRLESQNESLFVEWDN